MGLFKPPVRRLRDGRYEIALDEVERQALRNFLEQLRDLLLSDDPLLTRLFPPAYLDDPDRDDEYQQLMKGDLIESRFASIEVMEATLDERYVDEATLTRWLQAVNALRLVIGTRLDVSEELNQVVDPDDPDFGLWVFYDRLSHLVALTVNALTGGLPEPTNSGPE